ncbi:MAG: hypothetical protein MZV70_08770 [Desulfobacterales bacterium]|nr:hypothetical protein [Desulfobacterales bacterium]
MVLCIGILSGNGKIADRIGNIGTDWTGTGALEQPGFFSVAMRTIAILLQGRTRKMISETYFIRETLSELIDVCILSLLFWGL